MSNSTRNTIVLAIFFLLISALTVVQYLGTTKKAIELLRHNRIITKSIDSLEVELSTIDSLRAEHAFRKSLMDQQSKVIIGSDSPTISYGYLLDILKSRQLNVIFDFAATDTTAATGSYHEYIISGKSIYTNLLHLTHQLENQRAVITIEDLSVGTLGAAQADTVSFSMMLRTHYYNGGPQAAELTLKPLPVPYTGYQLFQPRISDELLPYEIDPTLLVVEEAKLIGISRGMAFFRDTQGIIRILSRGDRVAYGYLYRIDQATGKVVFRLDKYGLEEDFTVLINNTQ